MEEITILTAQKQLQEKKFSCKKGFKIVDDTTVLLYSLAPYLSEELTQFASVQILNKSKSKLLITVTVSFSFSSLDYEVKELTKRSYVLFRNSMKGGRLVSRSIPFGLTSVHEAMQWLEQKNSQETTWGL